MEKEIKNFTDLPPAHRSLLLVLNKEFKECQSREDLFAMHLVQSRKANSQQEANQIIANFRRVKHLIPDAGNQN